MVRAVDKGATGRTIYMHSLHVVGLTPPPPPPPHTHHTLTPHTPGGIAEMFLVDDKVERIKIRERRGFIKVGGGWEGGGGGWGGVCGYWVGRLAGKGKGGCEG